jgi:hypothetical protein
MTVNGGKSSELREATVEDRKKGVKWMREGARNGVRG